ncbi:IS110 family transposase [Photorhabdus tasmaniensis]|uniref:IS110 family transposase n=1 Tax=Photorhabdus tasmaniensis TaxID=1004159 RepID=UPI00105C230C
MNKSGGGYYVGIDVSKNKLDICLLYDGVKGKRKTKSLMNNEHSACMLIAWLAKYIPALQQANIVMEATGVYHEPSDLTVSAMR